MPDVKATIAQSGLLKGSATSQREIIASKVEVNTSGINLGDLTNVTLTSPSDGSYVIFQNSSNTFIDDQTIVKTGTGITLSGTLVATALDISGDVDVDGTLEADAITVNGITLAETISDTVGAMVGSNTESGIAVTYQDGDNTLDFDVADFSITLTGDVAGSGTVTNLGDVSFAATIQANSVALGTDTTGDYVGTITGGTGIDSTAATSGEGTTHTLSVDLNELGTETSIAQADFIAMVDATDDGSGKITFSHLEDTIFGNVSGDIAIAAGGAATIQATSVENSMLAGSIANAKLANSTISFGGVSLALGASDATPAFNLSDATNIPAAQLTGTIDDARIPDVVTSAIQTALTISTLGGLTMSALGSTTGGAVVFREGTGNGTNAIKLQAPAQVDGAGAFGTLDITFPNAAGTMALTSDLSSFITASSSDTLTNKSIDAGQLSGAITNGVTATTQSASDNSTKVATTAYTDTAVSNLVDSSPGALNTLNELAAAINDDASFSTTITNSIATKLPLAGGQMTGNITFSGSQTVDGRDLSADGTKLDAIEASATADQTAAEIRTLVESASDSNVFTDDDHSKLNAIEASADVTDATNVTAAGALMDSELTDLAGIKSLNTSTLQLKPSEGAFANGDKTKLDAIEASADVTDTANVTSAGALMDSELTDLAGVKSLNTSTLQLKPSEGAFANGDKTKLDAIEASADVTDTANVTAAGALMDSEVTNLAQVKAFDASDYLAAAGTATKATVTDSTANTNFPVVFNNESDGLLDDTGTFIYNPSTGLVSATGFSGTLTGTLQTAAQTNVTSLGALTGLTMAATSTTVGGKILFKEGTDNGTNSVTLQGPAATADVTVTLPNAAGTVALVSQIPTVPSSGISNGNVATFTTGVADDDFLRVAGTSIEGLSNTELKSALSLVKGDVGLGNVENTAISTFAGSSNITTTGAINSGSITSGFTSIDIGSGALTAGATTVNGNFIVNNDFMEIVSTTDSVEKMPIISLHRNGGAVADGSSDEIGAIKFYGQNENNEKKLFAGIYAEIGDTTDTDEVGELKFFLSDGSGVDDAVTDVTANDTTVEDPVMSLFKYGLQLRQDNDFMLSYRGLLRFEGITNNNFETDFGVEDPTADRYVTLPDASGCLEIGSLASQAVVTGTSVAHATFRTYKGQKLVFTGSSDCTIQLPDAAARGTITAGGSTPENEIGDVGATWTICNAGSANVILDLDGSGAAQTLKILTGASVVTVGTDNPHIVPGGVASLVCTAADNYILFGSGVVDN